MSKFIISFIVVLLSFTIFYRTDNPMVIAQTLPKRDSLPSVLPVGRTDLLQSNLRKEAVLKFTEHQLPNDLKKWELARVILRDKIIQKTGVVFDHDLPLDIRETGVTQLDGYKIKNIAFQTRPGVYATASLYVPDGEGPFPAVITMCGHSTNGRLYDEYQSVGHSLARNGYVCLLVDLWGGGERTTKHGKYEYHGGYLGASLMDIGETLMGLQISDNIRGVDLLSSLPYVDPTKIGATGASGGGNQTMWLAAIDERVKAAVPVVSVGTFESAVMRSNCICELLVDGLTFTEASGVLALIAPRAVKMCNHKRDGIPFKPVEMLRSYQNAKPIFGLYGVENNINYEIFDLTHGYLPEDREVMLGWFALHLKGIGKGEPKEEISFDLVPEEQILTYKIGKRFEGVITTADFCKQRGQVLREGLLNTRSFDIESKKQDLENILRINRKSVLADVHHYPTVQGWDRIALETTDNKLIPLLHRAPTNITNDYIIISSSMGKDSIQLDLLDEITKKGAGIIVVDLFGTGEASSSIKEPYYDFHTIARADLWLGRTMLGEWVQELDIVTRFLKSTYKAEKISIEGIKEVGISALFLSALGGQLDTVILRDSPISYLFDDRETVGYFSMAIHLPGFLKWGDVSLAAALSRDNIVLIDPVTMSGRKVDGPNLQQYRAEFGKLKSICEQSGNIFFN